MCVCVLHLLISKKKYGTRKRLAYAKVQRPCISFIFLNNFLLTEACFNVYRFVAVTGRLPIFRRLFLFVLAWLLNEINHYNFFW